MSGDLIRGASGFRVNGTLEYCCQDPTNRSEERDTDDPNLVYQRCRVCRRRHFRMRADPGSVGGDPGAVTE